MSAADGEVRCPKCGRVNRVGGGRTGRPVCGACGVPLRARTEREVPTHYETLGVSTTALPGEIRSAHKKLAMVHHPDRGGRHEDMVRINLAAGCLLNASKRAIYDAYLRASEPATNAGPPPTEGEPPPASATEPPPPDPATEEWATTYPPSDELDGWLDTWMSLMRAAADDWRDTEYRTVSRVRGMPVVAGESGTGIAFAVTGAVVAMVVLAPLWTLLPPVLGPFAMGGGAAIGTGVHWLVQQVFWGPERKWGEDTSVHDSPWKSSENDAPPKVNNVERVEPASPDRQWDNNCVKIGVIVGGVIGTMVFPCLGTAAGVGIGFLVASHFAITKE